MKAKYLIVLNLLTAFVLFAGCDRKEGGGPQSKAGEPHAGEGGASSSGPSKVTNRIDLPARVRENLGMTFAKVEQRRVAATIRVPGRFELLPSARREYRAPVPGRIELLVKQYQEVRAGTPLYRLHSPEWLKLRQQLQDDQAAAQRSQAELTSAQASLAEAQAVVRLLQERVAGLAEAGTRRADVETQLAERKATLPRLEAEIAAKRAEVEAAKQRFPLTLATAASLTGMTPETLLEEMPASGGASGNVPRWRTITEIEVKGAEGGVVEALAVTNGAWIEPANAVLTVVNPNGLRFRGTALQADLRKFRDGASASIVPPRGGGSNPADAVAGKAALGLEASPETRTVELIVTPAQEGIPWARAGISAYAEVVTDDSVDAEPAIPLAAVIQDELARVYFRRDPKDPDKVIRVEGDFGVSDGKWVVVRSGLKAGDEVVLDGVYELKLTGGGKTQGGGHFHADGTWHPDGTPEPGEKK